MPDIKYFSNVQSKSTGEVYVVKDKDARDMIDAKADNTPTFTEASTRANIVSGETMPTMLGKIKKFFTDLKTVAFSGSYTDLSDKPTIPAAANNGTLTIQKNGTNVQTFTANQSTNATANITVPTKTSDLANDSGYITGSYLPLSGGAMTGAGGIQYPTVSGNNKSGNFISAGGGFSTGSGKNGVKIIVCDQSDAVSGLGQDCGGLSGGYELSVIAPQNSNNGTAYISFLKHDINTPTKYTVLGYFNKDGNFYTTGSISENGTALSSKYAAKSDIPTVNNGTLTIQKNGTNVATFTANSSTNATANITVPTALSGLTDDATHRLVTDTEKSTWNSKATSTDITNAINALDVASIGGTGKYISTISETNGKITATATDLVAVVNPSTTPTAEGSIWIVTT